MASACAGFNGAAEHGHELLGAVSTCRNALLFLWGWLQNGREVTKQINKFEKVYVNKLHLTRWDYVCRAYK